MTKEEILQKFKERGEFQQDVDGFYYYAPKDGCLIPSYQLRIIADELDKMNKSWQEQVEKQLYLDAKYRGDTDDVPPFLV
jgi:hypothetical protein